MGGNYFSLVYKGAPNAHLSAVATAMLYRLQGAWHPRGRDGCAPCGTVRSDLLFGIKGSGMQVPGLPTIIFLGTRTKLEPTVACARLLSCRYCHLCVPLRVSLAAAHRERKTRVASHNPPFTIAALRQGLHALHAGTIPSRSPPSIHTLLLGCTFIAHRAASMTTPTRPKLRFCSRNVNAYFSTAA